MSFLEIVVIVLASSFVLLILGRYLYRRLKHLPTGECQSCKLRNSSKKIKEYYYEQMKKRESN